MEKQINDAEDIDGNKRSAWDTMSKISYENLKEVDAIAKMTRQTANVVRVTAYRATKKVKFNRRGKQHVIALERANKASAYADRAETEAQLADVRRLTAEQEDDDVQMINTSACAKSKRQHL